MRERDLLKRRRADWEELAQINAEATTGGVRRLTPAQLAKIGPLYRRALSDLAISRRHFPNSQLVGYINGLVAQTHALIYGGSRLNWGAFWRFVQLTFPQAVRQHIWVIGAMCGLFFLAAAVGAWGWSEQNEFVLSQLPAAYVGQLHGMSDLEFSALSGSGRPVMASFVMTNNIRVSLLAFSLGITFGLGTLWVVWQNGLLLGPLAFVFHQSGRGITFWSLILPHGVLELPAIFMTAAAGWLIGRALLLPGEYSRFGAARLAARRSLPLLGGTVLILVVAGTIEGFFTPSGLTSHTKLGGAVLVLMLFAFYLWLPGRVRYARKG